jgi:hypothetical protein
MQADSFHRLLKALVDSGESQTVEEAMSTFAGYGVRIAVGMGTADSVAEQIILLTAINTAARSFSGNVCVEGAVGLRLGVPGFEGQTLSHFCAWAGVVVGRVPAPTWPIIQIGEAPLAAVGDALRPWTSGWTFGIGPRAPSNLADGSPSTLPVFAPACVAAGALAVSEAFSLLRRDNPYAGRRGLRFSLWSMSEQESAGPDAGAVLSHGAWVIGLGHLGQAYCWTLGFMPTDRPTTILLQDIDTITESTLSTSVLSGAEDLGRKKTRVVSDWLEGRGFETRIVERRFDAATRWSATEPTTALFGVDNAAARRCCEQAGFSLVLDAGLGSGYRDFRALRVRAFPGASSAARLWAEEPIQPASEHAPAYRALLKGGRDPCGVTTLATRAVGAPFVGCYAAAIVVAELVKRRLTGHSYDVIDVNLRDPLALALA